jgi:hypothetical protein
MRAFIPLAFALGALLVLSPRAGAAADVYKCGRADGSLAYQDQPCADGDDDLPVPPLPRSSGLAPAQPELVAGVAPPADLATFEPEAPPLPRRYRCYKPEDGKDYVSADPNPPGRYVPLWAIDGYLPTPRGRVGAPAPRPPSSGPGVPPGRSGFPARAAAGYTYVQDRCVPMGRGELCAHFKSEYDRTHAQRRVAFNDTRGALEAEESGLRSQLETHCWN